MVGHKLQTKGVNVIPITLFALENQLSLSFLLALASGCLLVLGS